MTPDTDVLDKAFAVIMLIGNAPVIGYALYLMFTYIKIRFV